MKLFLTESEFTGLQNLTNDVKGYKPLEAIGVFTFGDLEIIPNNIEAEAQSGVIRVARKIEIFPDVWKLLFSVAVSTLNQVLLKLLSPETASYLREFRIVLVPTRLRRISASTQKITKGDTLVISTSNEVVGKAVSTTIKDQAGTLLVALAGTVNADGIAKVEWLVPANTTATKLEVEITVGVLAKDEISAGNPPAAVNSISKDILTVV